ncbi:helix-turn-helix domain-containing protein [Kitasatospora sp. GAS204B]|uniref:helix-turn-helix domain-containing protein n=1 Tax=unclassified Kitasatospora TaxID=2633591 RepID=UPI00247336ED|nr:helix-turn-helix domain-containing protein [Kitasatospora sp. GAS204B]MDH6121374.1 transcriptional regulator with XRE-family HTH domain [Kitasatospora sp. GAS204B]
MNSEQRDPARAGPAEVRPGHPGDLGRRVTQRREKLGLSRARLAAEAGLSASCLAYLESSPGVVELATLTRLANALSTTVWFLLGVSTDPLAGQPLPTVTGRPVRTPDPLP